eukprot:scaffold181742_cov23-Tisochrysis_lutea.AAC.3
MRAHPWNLRGLSSELSGSNAFQVIRHIPISIKTLSSRPYTAKACTFYKGQRHNKYNNSISLAVKLLDGQELVKALSAAARSL